MDINEVSKNLERAIHILSEGENLNAEKIMIHLNKIEDNLRENLELIDITSRVVSSDSDLRKFKSEVEGIRHASLSTLKLVAKIQTAVDDFLSEMTTSANAGAYMIPLGASRPKDKDDK